METTTSKKLTVIKATVKAKLATLLQDAGNLAMDIMTIPAENGFEIAGPQMWTYIGADGNPDSEFDLEISVPVTGSGTLPDGFELGETAEFLCVSYTHKGSWSEFPAVYEKLMNDICASGKIPTGICRETYLVCDMEQPESCVTEMHIGVQA